MVSACPPYCAGAKASCLTRDGYKCSAVVGLDCGKRGKKAQEEDEEMRGYLQDIEDGEQDD